MNVQSDHIDLSSLVSQDLRTNSRIIAAKFEKRHDNVQRDIRAIISTNPEWGVLNFEEAPYVDAQNGQTYQMYEMTRDGYSMLVMGFTGRAAMEWKIKFLAAFSAMEERLRAESRPALPDLSDPTVLTGLLLEHAAKRIEAEQRADAAEAKADAMQSDVEAHHRLTAADGSLTGTEAAKSLGIAPKELFLWLQTHGWIYRRPGSATWLGFQRRCNDGLLIHRVTTVLRPDGTERICEQVRITPKGLATLAKVIRPTAKLVVEN